MTAHVDVATGSLDPDEGLIADLFHTRVSVCVATAAMYDQAIFPEEAVAVRSAAPRRRREFVAGRTCARAALRAAGAPPGPILRHEDRSPQWPAGFIGSITHCEGFCCAVAAPATAAASLGVDAELADGLSSSMARLICRPQELLGFNDLSSPANASWAKVAFSAKEAFYKAYHPLTKSFLDFHDVSVRFTIDAAGVEGAFQVTLENLQRPGAELAARSQGRWRLYGGRIFTGAAIAHR